MDMHVSLSSFPCPLPQVFSPHFVSSRGQVHTEEDPPESSAQLHQDPLTGSGDSLPSCTTEDSIK